MLVMKTVGVNCLNPQNAKNMTQEKETEMIEGTEEMIGVIIEEIEMIEEMIEEIEVIEVEVEMIEEMIEGIKQIEEMIEIEKMNETNTVGDVRIVC